MGAVTVALAGATGLEARPTSAAKKRRRRGGQRGGAGARKVAICHFTSERAVQRIRVGGRALRAHLAHGDVRYVDCCVNEDCEVGACFSAQCVAGTCSTTQLPEGAFCTFGGGGAVGNCTATGQCLPTGSGGG
jgi:hypothetical protein